MWTPPDLDPSARPVEDNAFGLFRTAEGRVASLHASWTQWKNLFSYEVFGRDGYAAADGLGGSYGPERLTWGRRRPEGVRRTSSASEFFPNRTGRGRRSGGSSSRRSREGEREPAAWERPRRA